MSIAPPFTPPTSTDLLARWPLAIQFAREAGQHTLRYFQQPGVLPERKSDNSPVTIADREAELLLRERIEKAFPQDAILGEEFPPREGTSGFRWLLDPIDGTKSFISGVPLYGTMVGVEWSGRSVIGVVDFPGLGECITAALGQGAWLHKGNEAPARARVSDCAKLSDGTFVTSQVSTFATRGARKAFDELEKASWVTRTWGDCYGYLLVATGRAAVMVDPILNIWDAAAVQPILEEAGGTFTDWQGVPTIHAGEALGTNGHVLNEVLAITRAYSKPS